MRKILLELSLVVMLTIVFTISVSAVELREIWEISETEHDSVRAFLYENDNSYYTLDIRGTGRMKNWSGSARAPWSSFYGSKITTVTIEEGVRNIGEAAFSGCSFLNCVNLPNSIIDIGNIAFLNCVALELIEIPKSVALIGEAAFQNCDSITSISIPDSVETIKKFAFCACDKLIDVTIGYGTRKIEDWAFSNCLNLNSVKIHENVEEIGEGTFFGCKILKSIVVPKCKIVKSRAFGECYALSIYCAVESQPTGWDAGWNESNCPVVWDYKNALKEDVFLFKGYSFNELDSMAIGFDIDYKAIKFYEELTGEKLEFGVLFAGYDNLGGLQPLDQNGEAVTLNIGRVVKADLSGYNYHYYNFILTNVVEGIRDVKFVISAYLYDGEIVKYVQEDRLSDTVSGITYNEAKGN